MCRTMLTVAKTINSINVHFTAFSQGDRNWPALFFFSDAAVAAAVVVGGATVSVAV